MDQLTNPVRSYLLAYLIILVLTFIPQLIYSQQELFLAINQVHSNSLDFFFKWITFLGDGAFFGLIILILLFFSYRNALLGLIIFLGTALIAQVLKRFVFDDHLRPYAILREDYDLLIPEGITPLLNNSFPSGHTTSAFALSAFLVLVFSGRVHWAVLLTLAWVVGFSRIYLTHHFTIDVWIGSIIGTTGAILLFWWLDSIFDRKFGTKGLLNR